MIRSIRNVLAPALAALALLGTTAIAQEPAPPPVTYDAERAERLGADQYGMRSYIFVTLRTGPTEITDPDTRRELFAGHFANMQAMAERGELVLAGPLQDEGDKRGIFILDVENIDAAKALLEGDPTISSGLLVAEYSDLYASAALVELNGIHAVIQKTPIQ